MSEKEKKKPVEKTVGKTKVYRNEEEEYKVEVPEKLSRDDLIHLYSAIQQIFDEEHNEILEERRKKGVKTYMEYRGEEVVQEY